MDEGGSEIEMRRRGHVAHVRAAGADALAPGWKGGMEEGANAQRQLAGRRRPT